MRSNHRLIAMTLAAALLLSVIGPGLAMAEDDPTNTETTISVNAESAVVTVTADDEPVDGATITVTDVDDDATYDGAGEYETDENGTVDLPAPEEDVEVTIGTGDAETTATLIADDGSNADAFGQQLQGQLQQIRDILNGEGSDVPMGQHVAEWVTENNPGNAPDHAGPGGDGGPPEHAGPDGERGPPEHANSGKVKGDRDKSAKGAHADDTDDDETEFDDDDEDDGADDEDADDGDDTDTEE